MAAGLDNTVGQINLALPGLCSAPFTYSITRTVMTAGVAVLQTITVTEKKKRKKKEAQYPGRKTLHSAIVMHFNILCR